MAIRKSKINIDTEERSDFDNMMNDVENEVEEQQAEDGLVNRVPELKQLSEDIDKATNTFINATLELESAIQQYQRAEAKLGGAVTTISKKVDTINQHIDKVLDLTSSLKKSRILRLSDKQYFASLRYLFLGDAMTKSGKRSP